MEIIKHGNKYKDRKLVCEKCGCEFIYNFDDIHIEIVRDAYINTNLQHNQSCVACPECCNSIRIGY